MDVRRSPVPLRITTLWSPGVFDRLPTRLATLPRLVLLVHLPKLAGGDFPGLIATFRDVAMAGAALMCSLLLARNPTTTA